MNALKDCPGSDGTLSLFLRIPGNAENVRERYYRDARRLGLSKADADDGAQLAMLKLCQCSDTLADGTTFAPSHAFYSVRKYMRRSLYRGFTGRFRSSMLKRVARCDAEHRQKIANARGESFPDNPATIVSAMETAAGRVSRAMGRNAAAVRGMTMEDIRSLAMPDIRGLAEREPGDAPRVVDRIPGAGKPSMVPVPAAEGDGTEWRGGGQEWAEVLPPLGHSSRGRSWLRLVG